MTSLAFLSNRRRRPPPSSAFFVPTDLSGLVLIQALAALAADVLSVAGSYPTVRFQRRNTRSLIHKLNTLSTFFDFLRESLSSSPCSSRFPPSATLCFRELYILIYRVKILLDYCSESSQLWLLLRNPQISCNFHDLGQELATLLDVLPIEELRLSADVREQMVLIRRQCRRSKLYINPDDEELRRKIYSFLSDLEGGKAPDSEELHNAFVDQLGISDAGACHKEIEFLEEQIFNQEEDVDVSILGGVVALTRFCRFLLFGFQEMKFDRCCSSKDDQSMRFDKILLSQGSTGSDSSFTVPKDFCCPISLDMMRDPVIVSTGQTYDRASITQWFEEGHRTCPNSGQALTSSRLVPNKSLRSLISQWCAANGIPYNAPDSTDTSLESISTASSSKAAMEANQATARILVKQLLLDGQADAKAIAARELRLLAKTGRENRALIAELGAIPLLCRLLHSSDQIAQENAVTAILNLSIYDGNKGRIMEEDGCLRQIVYVLRYGWTAEARENAAATLFSLSAVHEFKKAIVNEPGAVSALANLLMQGSPRGKKDAVMALFNLSTHQESWSFMLDLGAISALIGALRNESVAEEAAGALALLVKQPIVAEAIGSEDTALTNLIGLLRRGTPKGKENAVAALQEMCRRGGLIVTQRVAKLPALGGLIQTILFTGTKRARRKAALLARMCQRSESSSSSTTELLGREWARDRMLTRTSPMSSSFRSGEVSVSTPMVPVL